MSDFAGDRLSDDELRLMTRLLARFCTHDLDQFEDWRLETPHGTVCISITRGIPAGTSKEAYAQIWPVPPKAAGRGTD